MAKVKAITDEEIIIALMNSGTIRAAAATLKISERSIYDRMNEGEFQALYKAAKADIMRQAVCNINSKLEAAINTVYEVMADKEVNAATRLQAAQTIINTAAKFADRLANTEQSVITQAESNEYAW